MFVVVFIYSPVKSNVISLLVFYFMYFMYFTVQCTLNIILLFIILWTAVI